MNTTTAPMLSDTITDIASTILFVAAGIAATQTHQPMSFEAATGAADLLTAAARDVAELPLDNESELAGVQSILQFVAGALPSLALDGISAAVADGAAVQLKRCAAVLTRAA